MTKLKFMALAMLLTGVGAQAFAQSVAEEEAARQEASQAERERIENDRVQRVREVVEPPDEVVDVEMEMRVAESRLAEAARRIGELSSRQLQVLSGKWETGPLFSDRPVLGVTIGSKPGKSAVEGIEIIGVSPGGAADEAGLRAGDVIVSVNKEAMSADSSENANEKLVDFLSAIEEGDALDVEYLRAGKTATVEVTPHAMAPHVFQFSGLDSDFGFAVPPNAPHAPDVEFNRFVFVSGDGGWGDMEMVELTKDLGRYFGTEEGLLVVRAPSDEKLKFRDGDVIQDIDGRKPKSVSHAIRILGSYQGGENLEIEIMRDKRRETLKIEMPDNRQSGVVKDFVVPRIESSIRIAPKIQVVPAAETT